MSFQTGHPEIMTALMHSVLNSESQFHICNRNIFLYMGDEIYFTGILQK